MIRKKKQAHVAEVGNSDCAAYDGTKWRASGEYSVGTQQWTLVRFGGGT